MTTRRNLIRAAAATPILAAFPTAASIYEPDPSLIAIQTYREARAVYVEACQRRESEAVVDAMNQAECIAAVAALTTVPTSSAGLRAFSEFGAWLLSVGEDQLAEWFPARNSDVRLDGRDAETMYLTTLATAARRLLQA